MKITVTREGRLSDRSVRFIHAHYGRHTEHAATLRFVGALFLRRPNYPVHGDNISILDVEECMGIELFQNHLRIRASYQTLNDGRWRLTLLATPLHKNITDLRAQLLTLQTETNKDLVREHNS